MPFFLLYRSTETCLYDLNYLEECENKNTKININLSTGILSKNEETKLNLSAKKLERVSPINLNNPKRVSPISGSISTLRPLNMPKLVQNTSANANKLTPNPPGNPRLIPTASIQSSTPNPVTGGRPSINLSKPINLSASKPVGINLSSMHRSFSSGHNKLASPIPLSGVTLKRSHTEENKGTPQKKFKSINLS